MNCRGMVFTTSIILILTGCSDEGTDTESIQQYDSGGIIQGVDSGSLGQQTSQAGTTPVVGVDSGGLTSIDAGTLDGALGAAGTTVITTAGTGGVAGGTTAGSGGAAAGSTADSGALRDVGTDSQSVDAVIDSTTDPVDSGNADALGCEGNQVLPPVTDIGQDGPFTTTTETRTGPTGSETIFRPEPLGTDGFLHPMITFGPGMMTSGGSSYTTLLTHLATLGFVVIAVETLNPPPGGESNNTDMIAALDWLITQNSAAGVYQDKLAVNCGIAMGYSLGASATPFVGEHPAVVTGVAIHGHIQMESAAPHGPVLFLTGNGPAAVGPEVQRVVAGMTSAPGLMAWYEGQGHMNVITSQLQKDQPEFVALTAWLRYWVNGDENAKNHFWGSNCGMCSDPNWKLEGNALWDALSL